MHKRRASLGDEDDVERSFAAAAASMETPEFRAIAQSRKTAEQIIAETPANHSFEREALVLNIVYETMVPLDASYNYDAMLSSDPEAAIARLKECFKKHFPHSADNRHPCETEVCEMRHFMPNEIYYSYSQHGFYRATGDVFVCMGHGRDHLCTVERCMARQYTDKKDNVVCRITGKLFGPDVAVSMADQPFSVRSNAPFASPNPVPLADTLMGSAAAAAAKKKSHKKKKKVLNNDAAAVFSVDGFLVSTVGAKRLAHGDAPLALPLFPIRRGGGGSFRTSTIGDTIKTIVPMKSPPPLPEFMRIRGSTDQHAHLSPIGRIKKQTRHAAAAQQPSQMTAHQTTLWGMAKSLHLATAERLFSSSNMHGTCETICRLILNNKKAKEASLEKVIEADEAARREAAEYCDQKARYEKEPKDAKIVAIYARHLVVPLKKLESLGAFLQRPPDETWFSPAREEDVCFIGQCMVSVWLMVHATPAGSRELWPIDKLAPGIFFLLKSGFQQVVKMRKRDSVVLAMRAEPIGAAAAIERQIEQQKQEQQQQQEVANSEKRSPMSYLKQKVQIERQYRRTKSALQQSQPGARQPFRPRHFVPGLTTATEAASPPLPVGATSLPPPTATTTTTTPVVRYDDTELVLQFIPRLPHLHYACSASDLSKHDDRGMNPVVVESTRYIKSCFYSLLSEDRPLTFFEPFLLGNHAKII